ncbi:MAG: MBOAT family protein [Roseburia sp.]|nr:MBOAT family protein [Roseburia sp.]
MVFSSFEFLFRFLPIFFIIYYFTSKKYKNVALFAGSIAFYTVGEAEYVLLLLLCVFINYFMGQVMYRWPGEKRGLWQKTILALALGYDFGILFFFKYSGLSATLPLGISFYTFQIAAYMIDVYREKIPAEKSFVNLGTYLTMFPQLIAGPIINYADVRERLIERSVTPEQFEDGLKTLILGLGAKVIVADRIGMLWKNIQSIGFASISTPLAWMGAFAYSIELYFDFAGYSMMARGLGRMLGFEIPVNFRHPYISKSVTEFWRRWHITLGKWFREYVYIPLGGNRKGKLRTFFNLFVVWSLTALWHGAGYNYLIWGASLLFLLGVEKLFLLPYLDRSRVLCHAYLLFVVPLTWVAFAVTDVQQLGIYYTRMFPFLPQSGGIVNQQDYVKYLGDFWPLFLLGILFSTPIPYRIYRAVKKSWLGSIAVAVILALSMYYLAVSTNNPFMYFNF